MITVKTARINRMLTNPKEAKEIIKKIGGENNKAVKYSGRPLD